MLHRILTALTSKAAIAVAVGTLAAGAAATAGPALVNDTRPDDSGSKAETLLLESSDDRTTKKTTEPDTDDDAHDATKGGAAHDRAPSDSFGAMVSEDARDGGVDGQDISKLARERNAERAADRSVPDDDAAEAADDTDDGDVNGERGRGRSDDHRGDEDRRGGSGTGGDQDDEE